MDNITGRRCILFVRGMCEMLEGGIEDQLSTLNSFAQKHGLVVVGEVRVENALADGPRTLTAIQTVLDRKRYCDDFDLLVATDWSRITRRGMYAAHDLQGRFDQVGVRVIFPADLQLPTVFSGVFRSWQCSECAARAV